MNIMYCGDRNIEQGVLISVLSLLRNAGDNLNIYLLTAHIEHLGTVYEPIEQDFADKLDALVKETHLENSVQLFDITDLFCAMPPSANMDTRFTPCCMLRLYADLVDAIPDRVLYLDYDVMCNGSIIELYNQDMRGHDIAGVLDYYGQWFFHNGKFALNYLNSGVLLLNMELIRKNGLFAACRNTCARHQMFMPDQTALNKHAENKLILPRRFNEQRKFHADTVLQHFTTSFRFFPLLRIISVKPWQTDKMHDTLKLHCYDDLLETFETLKPRFIERDAA